MGTPFVLTDETITRIEKVLNELPYTPIEISALDQPMMQMLKGIMVISDKLDWKSRRLKELKKEQEELSEAISNLELVKTRYESIMTTAFGGLAVDHFLNEVERSTNDYYKMENKEKELLEQKEETYPVVVEDDESTN